MIGTVWLAMTYGTRARSSSCEWTKTVARTSPRTRPEDEPDRRLAPGVERGLDELLGERLGVGAALPRLGVAPAGCSRRGAASGRSRTASGTAGSRGSGCRAARRALATASRRGTSAPSQTTRIAIDGAARTRRPAATPARAAAEIGATASAAGGDRGRHRASPSTAWSAISRARSMIAKPSAELLLGDAQRRVRVDRVVGDHRVQAVLAEELADRLHLVARPVERGQRRPRVAAPDEVEDPEQAEVPVRPRPTGASRTRSSWWRRMTSPSRAAFSIRPSSS